eukprot:scaffold4600_cov169-Amphora_coffeaeformis.AAC.4
MLDGRRPLTTRHSNHGRPHEGKSKTWKFCRKERLPATPCGSRSSRRRHVQRFVNVRCVFEMIRSASKNWIGVVGWLDLLGSSSSKEVHHHHPLRFLLMLSERDTHSYGSMWGKKA